uniref:Receptor ligand binding region domain-containing protein n=1 Tax=Aegilops tauschii subsp. strangulata TaxID=200361 RepID=A0A453KVT9_AEGTS
MQCISAPKNLKLAVPHGMERTPRAILFLLLLLLVDPGVAQNTTGKADEFHVGVILNLGSLVGKVARTSISLAVQDFYAVHQNYSTKLTLHFRDSMASDVKAASAGMCLQYVKVKLSGFRKTEGLSFPIFHSLTP